jgi:[ribosomal protein S5]-alanine N-acetyltransferase
MSRISEAAEIELVALDLANLRRLAASEPAEFEIATPVAAGALPPAHVAARALAQLDEGTPVVWCIPFLIVAADTGAVLGGCRFKGAPVDGSVEIGYGVAKSERGRGVASAALAKLIEIAAATGEARQIVAHILPGNVASSKLVAKLGFCRGHSFVDSDGEVVVHWVYPLAS